MWSIYLEQSGLIIYLLVEQFVLARLRIIYVICLEQLISKFRDTVRYLQVLAGARSSGQKVQQEHHEIRGLKTQRCPKISPLWYAFNLRDICYVAQCVASAPRSFSELHLLCLNPCRPSIKHPDAARSFGWWLVLVCSEREKYCWVVAGLPRERKVALAGA
jgi:hypothetical protein